MWPLLRLTFTLLLFAFLAAQGEDLKPKPDVTQGAKRTIVAPAPAYGASFGGYAAAPMAAAMPMPYAPYANMYHQGAAMYGAAVGAVNPLVAHMTPNPMYVHTAPAYPAAYPTPLHGAIPATPVVHATTTTTAAIPQFSPHPPASPLLSMMFPQQLPYRQSTMLTSHVDPFHPHGPFSFNTDPAQAFQMRYPSHPALPVVHHDVHVGALTPQVPQAYHAGYPAYAGVVTHMTHTPIVAQGVYPGFQQIMPHFDYHTGHYDSIQAGYTAGGTGFLPQRPPGVCNFEQSFLCWGVSYCISRNKVCDHIYDCVNAVDENPQLCVEGRRPSVESITHFLQEQGWIHRNLLNENKTPEEIAKVLKSAESVEELRWRLNLSQEHVNNTRKALQAALEDRVQPLKDLGMTESDMETVKYFFRTLMDTGLKI